MAAAAPYAKGVVGPQSSKGMATAMTATSEGLCYIGQAFSAFFFVVILPPHQMACLLVVATAAASTMAATAVLKRSRTRMG